MILQLSFGPNMFPRVHYVRAAQSLPRWYTFSCLLGHQHEESEGMEEAATESGSTELCLWTLVGSICFQEP